MDETTRSAIRNDISRGLSATDAAANAGYGGRSMAVGQQVHDAMKAEETGAMLDRLWAKDGPNDGSSDGAAGLFILLAVALCFGAVVKVVMGAVILGFMAIGIIVALRDGRCGRLLIETLVFGAVFAALFYVLRGGADAGAVPNLWFVEFPALATGHPVGDAAVMGIWAAPLLTTLPPVRDHVFDALGWVFAAAWTRLFYLLGTRAFVMRLLGLILLAGVMAAPALMIARGVTWQLGLTYGYVLVLCLMAAGSLWLNTRSFQRFMEGQALAHGPSTRKIHNMDLLRGFVASQDMRERYALSEALAFGGMRVGRGAGLMRRDGEVQFHAGRVFSALPAQEAEALHRLEPLQMAMIGSALALYPGLDTQGERRILARYLNRNGFGVPQK
ncbi:hypothetical protein IV417_04145 [Alphaproteobacteria bacterium KMM 3653]|uniref:Uncharacterized protein n=1 Tax=Harenicola maris TaxID=2841044 RepID=A0AAP2CMZ8_9RHOB|nr:hypothetical protein [Harenicola maris]